MLQVGGATGPHPSSLRRNASIRFHARAAAFGWCPTSSPPIPSGFPENVEGVDRDEEPSRPAGDDRVLMGTQGVGEGRHGRKGTPAATVGGAPTAGGPGRERLRRRARLGGAWPTAPEHRTRRAPSPHR